VPIFAHASRRGRVGLRLPLPESKSTPSIKRMHVYGVVSVSLGLVLCGCGSGEPTVRDELLGSWITSGDSIAVSYTFIGDGTYEYNLAYLLSPQLEIFVIAGNYELRAGTSGVADDNGAYLFLQPLMASCPIGPSPVGFSVALDGDSLLLVGETSVTDFERVKDPDDADGDSGSARARYGCFTPDGFFAYPIEEF
jgi:hypothetical protein